MGAGEDDQAVRNSYRLLGAVSLLQLAITLALQVNNYRHRQRARQEWKLYRSLEPRYGRRDGSSWTSCLLHIKILMITIH